MRREEIDRRWGSARADEGTGLSKRRGIVLSLRQSRGSRRGHARDSVRYKRAEHTKADRSIMASFASSELVGGAHMRSLFPATRRKVSLDRIERQGRKK